MATDTMKSPARSVSHIRPFGHRRRGAAYVLFVGVAMIVTVIGLSSIMAMRVQLREATDTGDSSAARFYARSAIELGLVAMRKDKTWRSTKGGGVWMQNVPIGDGTLNLMVTILDDGDGNPWNDSAALTGTGICNSAAHSVEVIVMPVDNDLTIQPNSWRQVIDVSWPETTEVTLLTDPVIVVIN